MWICTMLLIMQMLWSQGKTEHADTCQFVLTCYAWSLPRHSSSSCLRRWERWRNHVPSWTGSVTKTLKHKYKSLWELFSRDWFKIQLSMGIASVSGDKLWTAGSPLRCLKNNSLQFISSALFNLYSINLSPFQNSIFGALNTVLSLAQISWICRQLT